MPEASPFVLIVRLSEASSVKTTCTGVGLSLIHIFTPNAQSIGFDYEVIIPATVDRVPCVFVENGRVVGLDPNDPITVNYEHKVGDEEVTITFYAAECGEFHDLGEYTKCRTLEEAYKKYQKYCRTSANMCPAIEFSIHDPESIYSDMEYPLPLSSKDRGDLELVPYYNEHPLVNEAIRQVEQLQKQQEKKKHRDVAR